ncbi:hypothetical protein OIU85_023466 [Salix viminalis]|uniref:Uncharacterized protein n=1 Tax=Salix viminalis TaxID=40686 RepID=A0A9Q0TYQ7_SALVM|nr:hypothetical protein OIU85_023466 [Salix viminalis]
MHCGRQLLTHVVNGSSTADTTTRNVKMRKAAMIFLMDIFFRDSANFECTIRLVVVVWSENKGKFEACMRLEGYNFLKNSRSLTFWRAENVG